MLASPVLVAYYPPMTDLPFHEGAIGILRNLGDASRFPPGLYERNLGQPNQLFHLAGWALSYLVSTRWAVKIVVAASVVAVPVCAARLARHAGASPLASLVLAPMALGWLFGWGLVANLIGLAAFVAALPALDSLAREPTPKRAAAAMAGVALLYFAHYAMMVLYAGAALALAVLHPWSPKRTAGRLSPLGAAVALAVMQMPLQQRVLTQSIATMPTRWHSIGHKLVRLLYLVQPATDTLVQAAMFTLCVAAIGSFFWLRARERTAEHPSEPPLPDPPPVDRPRGPGTSPFGEVSGEGVARLQRLREWTLGHRWTIFAAACFAAYLAFPLTLHGATLVYQRFFPPAFAVLAVTAAPRDLWTRAARLTRIVVFVLPVATLLTAWPSFVDSTRVFEALDEIAPNIEPGSAIAQIDLGPADLTRTYSPGTAAGRLLATRGGRLAYAFTDTTLSPVVLARPYQWTESLTRVAKDSWAFRPAHDCKRFRYVVVRTSDPVRARMATIVLAPWADFVAASSEWLLFRSKLPVVPLASGDEPLEDPPPESVRDFIDQMLGALRARDAPAPFEPPAIVDQSPPL